MNNIKHFFRPSLGYKFLTVIFVIFVVAFAVIFWHESSIRTEFKASAGFTKSSFQVADYKLFDLGVVDINNDKIFDVFSVNHSALQSLLIGGESGKFSDVLSQLKLDQSRDFPGLEEETAGNNPRLDAPGLYIYWRDRFLIIQSYQIGNMGEVSGEIELSTPVSVEEKHNFDLDITANQLPSGATRTSLRFTVKEDAHLIIKPELIALPISFDLNNNIPLDSVYIGSKQVQPSSHEFVLLTRDRHGMAWADYDGDDKLDLFITRGGLMGQMSKLPETFSDELLVNIGPEFSDRTAGLGLVKNGCSGYQVAWVDFNNDNKLDLYISCQRGNPNQLYQQDSEGNFVNVASKLGLDISENQFGEPFLWLDVDNDEDVDLLLAQNQRLLLYVNQLGSFRPQSITDKLPGVKKLAVNDYDLDGDLDIYAASPWKSTLILNNQGKLTVINPKKIGLPIQSKTANWVDFDNDGLPDLHSVPGGLYRQRQDHTFETTHLLEHESPSSIIEARCTWFDENNDGTRDLLMAVWYDHPWWIKTWQNLFQSDTPQWFKRPKKWKVTFSKNTTSANHWLQLKLVGLAGNHEAIGAKVILDTPNGKMLQEVGNAEGSHFSQGHYRLYFGLGREAQVNSLKVIWHNGKSQVIKNPSVDSLLVIEEQS
ncbi:CRTAC1 family protein [Crocosphaera sp.]|uniref:CRTAC1 family protein n=1 Tax=Crocosphaera sp. TaxID=2729996 RepID=UPI003F28A07F|nr:CRTAC1 family protein [Crocosphaera sp.]